MPRAGPLRTYAYVHILYLPYYMSQQYCWWILVHSVLRLSKNYPVSNLILPNLMYVFLSNPKCWFYFTKSFTCCFYHGLLMLLVLEKWKNHIPIRTVCECDSLSIILIGLCQPKWSQCVFKMISTLTWKRLTSTMTQKHSCHFLIFSGVNKRVWITKLLLLPHM